MKRTLVRYRKSKLNTFLKRHKKYAPVGFFISGFIWDTLTLGRIDRLYDITILCTYMVFLTVSIYIYNVVDSEKWKNNFFKQYGDHLPLAIQFFLGGLSSAYVIYFSRTVSLSKTASFFIILVIVFIANERLRNRLSDKYVQFGTYFFVNFMFLSFFIPVLLQKMNQTIFLFSGLLSLVMTLGLILLVYSASLVARTHIVKWKMMVLILGIYGLINGFYFLKLIPPVPLALDKGLVAYDIQKQHGHYKVSYEVDEWYVFWRDHKIDFHKNLQEPVYVFTSIFAPTDLKKKIYHRWQWYNTDSEAWETIDNIGYTIVGGRDGGFRGYTYKQNIWKGQWKVEVVTNEDLVIGVVDFNINTEKSYRESKLITKTF